MILVMVGFIQECGTGTECVQSASHVPVGQAQVPASQVQAPSRAGGLQLEWKLEAVVPNRGAVNPTCVKNTIL